MFFEWLHSQSFFVQQPPPPLVKTVWEERSHSRQSAKSNQSLGSAMTKVGGTPKRSRTISPVKSQRQKTEASATWTNVDSGLEVQLLFWILIVASIVVNVDVREHIARLVVNLCIKHWLLFKIVRKSCNRRSFQRDSIKQGSSRFFKAMANILLNIGEFSKCQEGRMLCLKIGDSYSRFSS